MEQPQLKLSREALDRPTRAGLNRLIRELPDGFRWQELPSYREYREADEEYERMIEEFRNTPKMRALHAKVQRLRDINNQIQRDLQDRSRYVKNLYHLQGFTKKVAALLSDLVDEINGVVSNGKKGNRRRKGR
jgi:hypothetical protein